MSFCQFKLFPLHSISIWKKKKQIYKLCVVPSNERFMVKYINFIWSHVSLALNWNSIPHQTDFSSFFFICHISCVLSLFIINMCDKELNFNKKLQQNTRLNWIYEKNYYDLDSLKLDAKIKIYINGKICKFVIM